MSEFLCFLFPEVSDPRLPFRVRPEPKRLSAVALVSGSGKGASNLEESALYLNFFESSFGVFQWFISKDFFFFLSHV